MDQVKPKTRFQELKEMEGWEVYRDGSGYTKEYYKGVYPEGVSEEDIAIRCAWGNPLYYNVTLLDGRRFECTIFTD